MLVNKTNGIRISHIIKYENHICQRYTNEKQRHRIHETRTQREDSNAINTKWNALTDNMNRRYQQVFNSEWSSLFQNRFWVQIDCIHSTQLEYVIYLMSQVIKMSRRIVKSVFWYSVFEFKFLKLRKQIEFQQNLRFYLFIN